MRFKYSVLNIQARIWIDLNQIVVVGTVAATPSMATHSIMPAITPRSSMGSSSFGIFFICSFSFFSFFFCCFGLFRPEGMSEGEQGCSGQGLKYHQ